MKCGFLGYNIRCRFYFKVIFIGMFIYGEKIIVIEDVSKINIFSKKKDILFIV